MNRNKIVLLLPLLLSLAVVVRAQDAPTLDRTLAKTGVFFVQEGSSESAQAVFVQAEMTKEYAFTRKAGKWAPASGPNPPLSDVLGLEVDQVGSWEAAFGIKSPQTIGWAGFWSQWAAAMSSLTAPEIRTYVDAKGVQRRLLIEKLSPVDWQGREGKEFEGQMGIVAAPPPGGQGGQGTRKENPPTPPSTEKTFLEKYGRTILYTAFVAVVLLAILLTWLFWRHLVLLLGRSALAFADRVLPTPKGAITLENWLGRIHQHALDKRREQNNLVETEDFLCGAMRYTLQEYKAAAAEVMPHPLIAAEREGATASTQQQSQKTTDLASLGALVLDLCKDGKKARHPHEAQLFITTELKRLDSLDEDLKAEKSRNEELLKQIEKARTSAEEMSLLRAAKSSLEATKTSLEGQLHKQQQALANEKNAHEETRKERDKYSRQFDEQRKTVSQQVEAEKAKGRRAIEEKDREFGDTKAALEKTKNQAVAKASQLEGELATTRQAKMKAEGLVLTLETTLETERALHVNQAKGRKNLDAKLARIHQANNYLRAVQKAYWDRCKHPVSTGAVLYSTYLGLFQATAGAAGNDANLEVAGWTNLMNLLRRLSRVPGLEQYQNDFGPRVYPEIESLELRGTVDNNKPDPERFVHSSVLQALLSGEIQIDDDPRNRLSLERLRGWPLYFRVDQSGIWGAT